jgi:quinol monooxygenase YgiN
MSPQPRHDPGESSFEQVRETAREIHGTSRIKIFDGELERFRALAQECVDIVRAHDSGTLEYRFYLNAAGTEAFVHERYRDSAAGLEHMRNIGRVMESLSEVCAMTGEVCGEPTAELRKALTAADVTIYSPLVSSD